MRGLSESAGGNFPCSKDSYRASKQDPGCAGRLRASLHYVTIRLSSSSEQNQKLILDRGGAVEGDPLRRGVWEQRESEQNAEPYVKGKRVRARTGLEGMLNRI